MQTLATLENLRRLRSYLEHMGVPVSAVTFTASSTSTSPNLTAVVSFNGLAIGMTVTGPGILPGTTILSMGVSDSIVLSQNATSSNPAATYQAAYAGTAEIHLAMSAILVGDNPVPADFTEATFDGYAAKDVATLAGPYLQPDGSAEVDCSDGQWVLTATPTTPNTIYGYWIDYTDSYESGFVRTVALWESFATPQPMTAIGDAVVMDIPFKYPLPGSATVLS